MEPRITLGLYSAQIAALIRNRDPGQPGDFPFFGVLSIDGQNQPVATVTPLAKGTGRIEGHQYYMMSYAYCDWTFIIARPGPQLLAQVEEECRRERMCLLLTVPYNHAKSFNLWVDILRQLRQ
jgi:hypothetical protein